MVLKGTDIAIRELTAGEMEEKKTKAPKSPKLPKSPKPPKPRSVKTPSKEDKKEKSAGGQGNGGKCSILPIKLAPVTHGIHQLTPFILKLQLHLQTNVIAMPSAEITSDAAKENVNL